MLEGGHTASSRSCVCAAGSHCKTSESLLRVNRICETIRKQGLSMLVTVNEQVVPLSLSPAASTAVFASALHVRLEAEAVFYSLPLHT